MITTGDVATQPLEKRRYERTAYAGEARLRIGRGLWSRRTRARLRNASLTGACIEIPPDSRLAANDYVSLHWTVPSGLNQAGTLRHYRLNGRVVRTRPKDGQSQLVGIRFQGLVTDQIRRTETRPHRTLIGTIMLVLLGCICVLKTHNVISFWYEPIFQAYSLAAAGFILSRMLLAAIYREPEDCGYTPSVSIVIPAMNEERHIAETVRRCFSSRYPSDLLEVIVIDDGSKDRTWAVLAGLQADLPRLRLFRFVQNQGKRYAMALGAQKAQGKILVYVDSDSYVDPEGLYRIVQAFNDPRVGAVAGHTLVQVDRDSFISKMESVRYYFSHRILKTAESVFGAVTCCPGPFSAYRRDLVLKALPAWIGQTFLGAKATFGDDRSLTNFILRTHRAVFHAGARCFTHVPETWQKFVRQQLRWKKSWMRETTIAARLMRRKHPATAISYYISVVITLLSPIIALRALLYVPLAFSGSCLPYVTGLLLVYLVLCLVYFYETGKSHWYYGMAFAPLYVAFLSLQNYYAMLTVSRNHWGTR